MKTARTVVLSGALLLPLLGCEAAPEPVATVNFEPAQLSLPYPSRVGVRVQWEMNALLGVTEGDPRVFVHLLDEAGSVERTFDHPLPFSWQPGSRQDYEFVIYQSALGPPLDNGDYRLSLGLYDRGGQRWALDGMGEEVAELEYQVAEVRVNGRAEEVPMFYFSPSWLGLEAGTDVQILGRRWLTGEGSIRVAEISGEGTVWMRIWVPEPEPELQELEPAEEGTAPGFRIGGTCGGAEEMLFSGFGFHDFEIPVKADGEGRAPEECEILIQPNFHIVEVDTLARKSLLLEILSWSVD